MQSVSVTEQLFYSAVLTTFIVSAQDIFLIIYLLIGYLKHNNINVIQHVFCILNLFSAKMIYYCYYLLTRVLIDMIRNRLDGISETALAPGPQILRVRHIIKIIDSIKNKKNT